MAIQYLSVSWETYQNLVYKISASILSHSPHVNQIVAISRGGLTFGHLCSDFLRIPVATITIQSYSDIQKSGEITITEPLTMDIHGKEVLLVDDVADSGKTLKRATEYLQGFSPKSITVATLFYKERSIFRPDYFARKTSRWILFPYEPIEMILLITKNMERERKSKSEIQSFLHALGYATPYIRYVRKYFLS
jgi:hypoxanthine phosphoribosyltransferase